MALRSPTPFHNFWGINSPTTSAFWVAGNLPNEGAAGPSPYYGNDNVQIGDFAYVDAAATFYVCTVAGTSAGGGATSVQITTGAASIDRFAPRYIVGGSSDSATAYDSGGFTYIPTNLNAGWQAQLQAALNTNAGDVHFRPGTFTLTGPITVPLAASVRGAGRTTIFSTTAAGDDTLGAFVLRAGSTLSDCAIAASAPANSTDATTLGVVYVYAGASPVPGKAHVENVYATYFLDLTSSVTACQSIYRVGASMAGEFSDCENLLTGTLGIGASSLGGWLTAAGTNSLVLSSCAHSGGDDAVVHLGYRLNLSQFQSVLTNVNGVFVNAESLVNIVNSTFAAAAGSCLSFTSADCNLGLSNSVLDTADLTAASFASIGKGRVVGNSISGTVAVDTTGATGHAIGFNVFSGTVTTETTDEVAHNI